MFNLKKCRLVSSLWASEATPLLLHRSKISFKTIPELTSVLSDFSPDTLSALCTSFDISSELNLSSDGVLEFFAKFGPIIKSLDLSFHTDYGDSWASRVFPGLTSLQELCLNGASSWLREESFGTQPCDGMTLKFLFIYDSSMDDDNIGPWLENVYQLLCTQRNLERLFFAPFLETRAHSFFNVFSSEGLFHSRISHLHINHLSATPLQLRALISRNLPLKYVHLVLTPTLGRQDVEEFLVKTCATLRELTLTFTEGATTSQFHPLPLDHLSKLSLIGYAGPLITGTARNLQLFVMSLPDNQVDNHVDNHVLNLNQECRDLEIYDSKGKYDPVTVQLVVGHFTGLKSLKMNNIDNTLLRQVYLNCPGLTELSICYHKFYGVSPLPIDGGLCGIPEFRLGEELLQVFGEEELRGLRCYPWIGGMKCEEDLRNLIR